MGFDPAAVTITDPILKPEYGPERAFRASKLSATETIIPEADGSLKLGVLGGRWRMAVIEAK